MVKVCLHKEEYRRIEWNRSEERRAKHGAHWCVIQVGIFLQAQNFTRITDTIQQKLKNGIPALDPAALCGAYHSTMMGTKSVVFAARR
jgi:hypothetical protein